MRIQATTTQKIVMSFFFAILFMLISIPSVFASGQPDVPFSIRPILPDNQDEGITSYISITPNNESIQQTLQFIIENKQDKVQHIKVEPVNAYTSPNGVVEYIKEKRPNSDIVHDDYFLAEYMDVLTGDEITLEPNESAHVSVALKVDDIEGTLLGGVSFLMDMEQTNEGSFQLNNRLNQVVGVIINNPTDKLAEFSFGDVFVEPTPSYYVVRLPITQHHPLLLHNVTIDYDVFFKGKELFGSIKEVDFAPTTKANFAIPFDASEIEKNKPYTLKGTLTYTDGDGKEKQIEFEKEFVYTGHAPNGDGGKSIIPPIEQATSYWWVFLLIALALIGAYVYYRKNAYVLLNDNDPVLMIKEGDGLFEQVKRRKDVAKEEWTQHQYVHYYVKKKQKQGGITMIVYKHRRTQTNKRYAPTKDEQGA